MAPRTAPFPYTTDVTQIPTMLLEHPKEVGDKRRIVYQCPDACWREHCDAWSRRRQRGERDIPEPMPYGHLMFETPTSYGYVPLGCTDEALMREAITHTIRGNLDGWGAMLANEPEKFEAIIAYAVAAKMQGIDVGPTPYVACVYAGIYA